MRSVYVFNVGDRTDGVPRFLMRSARVLAITFGCLIGTMAHAQGLPKSQPIRIVTQYAPGGGSDLLGRLLAQELEGVLGQTVILESKPGGSGAVANNYVAAAKPDGTTLLFVGSGATTINPHLMKKGAPANPLATFRPVAMVAKADLMFLVPATLPVKTIPDFIALAKKSPGELNYASSGSGTAPHVAGALFAKMAGVDIRHVAYQGSGPTYLDLVAGRTQMMFSGLGISMPFLKGNKLRVIATGGQARSENLPDVPTIAESALPGFEATVWYGVLAPKGVPEETVEKLNKAIRTVMTMPSVKKRLTIDNYSLSESQMTTKEFGDKIALEFEMWGKTLPQIGVTVK